MDKYTTDLDRTGNVAGIGSVTQPATALRRFGLYEASVALNTGSLVDAMREWQIVTLTAVATGTSITPAKVDPAAGAPTILSLDLLTAEGTEGVILATKSIHERANYTWTFYPGTELIVPVTNNNGLKLKQSAASATVAKANLNFID